ncbi:MAG: hypothetical protein HUU16_01120 [Candidatus Omnitrophica bacterium]|nr:hypothetical protein [Candidatus Omnitrophota bacterium]
MHFSHCLTPARILLRAILIGILLALWAVAVAAEWRFHSPLPQGNTLHAAWAMGPDNVYFGGEGGTLLHWNGNAWNQEVVPTQRTIFSIHGTSATDIWAVGGDAYASDQHARSLVLHFDGSTWSDVPPPMFLDYTYVLGSVFAIAPDNAWATNDGGPSLVHWDGATWSFDLLPSALEGRFLAVFALGPDHVFAAGTHGQIVHRDHGVWQLEQKLETGSFSTNLLMDLWGSDLDHLYATGNHGQVYKRNANGTWSEIVLPQAPGEDDTINAIWGASATEIYLMGNHHIRVWDGTGNPVRHEFFGKIRNQWFTGTGAPGRLYLAGPGGVTHEFLPSGGVLSPLSAGETASALVSQVRATGCGPHGFLLYGMTELTQDYPIQYFDGGKLMRFPVLPAGMNTQTWVRAMLASDFDDIVVNWSAMSDFSHGTYHWNGATWEPLGTSNYGSTPFSVKEFWRSPTGVLYACETVRVQRYDGPEWSTIFPFEQVPVGVGFTCIWGRSDTEIFIASDQGRIWRYNGNTWSEETTPGAVALAGISGFGPDVYAVGVDGSAWRRSGTNWQQMTGVEIRPGDDFLAIVAGPDGVYAAQTTPGIYIGGGLGRLWKFSGAGATRVLAGLSSPIEALATASTGTLFGVGVGSSGFSILREGPGAPTQELHRVDLSSATWTSFGVSGVEVQSGVVQPGKPLVAAWSLDHAPALFRVGGATDLAVADQYWMLLQDTFMSGSALPPSLLRVNYDPAALPGDFPLDHALLHRYGNLGWSKAATWVDSVAHTATIQSATQLSPWAFAEALEIPTPGPTPTVTQTPTLTLSPTPFPTETPTASATSPPTVTPTAPPLPDLALLSTYGISTDPTDAPLNAPFHFSVFVTYTGEPRSQTVLIQLSVNSMDGATFHASGLGAYVDLSQGSFSRWVPFEAEFDPAGLSGSYSLTAEVDPGHTVAESNENNNQSWSYLKLSGSPPSDPNAPTGTVTINGGAKLVNGDSIWISYSAGDDSGVVESLYVREWWLNDSGRWVQTWDTGWIPYHVIDPAYRILWSGSYYLEVYYSDPSGNVSLPVYASVAVAKPFDTLLSGQVTWLLIPLNSGQLLDFVFDPLFGDCDLAAWFPGNQSPNPDLSSTNIGEVIDRLNFSALTSGGYWIGLACFEDSAFDLSASSTKGLSPLPQGKDFRKLRTPDWPAPPVVSTPVSRMFSGPDVSLSSSDWVHLTARTWRLSIGDEGYDGRCDLDAAEHRIDARDLVQLLKPGTPPPRPSSERP